MDPIVLVIIVAIGTPVGVIWALSKSAALRGPLPRPESRRPVEALVTDVIPEEHPDDDQVDDDAPDFRIDSAPPDPADGQQRRPDHL
jgi:hypothetical protein